MGRHSCCVKQKLRKGLWSPEEDEKLFNHINRFGVGCWSSVPKQAGLLRCGKSCRLRWINYLRPDLKRGMFSNEEEELIINLHKLLGNRWAQISAQLPGRTDNEIKNFWNSSVKKKFKQQGIDPNTHKPLNHQESNGETLQQSKIGQPLLINTTDSSNSLMETGLIHQVPSDFLTKQQSFDPFPFQLQMTTLDQTGMTSDSNLLFQYHQNSMKPLSNQARLGMHSEFGLPNLSYCDYSNVTEKEFSDNSTMSSLFMNETNKESSAGNSFNLNEVQMSSMLGDAAVFSWETTDHIKLESPFHGFQLKSEEMKMNSEGYSSFGFTSQSSEDGLDFF